MKIFYGFALLLSLPLLHIDGQGVPPTSFETYPLSVQIKVTNETARLTCVAATGTRPLLYTWLKDGKVDTANSTDVKLRFRVDKNRQGNYRCIAANNYGAILGLNATVFAARMDAKWSNLPQQSLPFEAGRTAILNLPAHSIFPTPSVKWTVDKIPVTNYDYSLRHFVSEISFRLVLLDIQTEQDNLIYQAVLNSGYLEKELKTSYYNVQVTGSDKTTRQAPETVIFPQNVTFPFDKVTKNVFFECVFNARPLKDLKIIWFHRKGSSRKLIQGTAHTTFSHFNRTLKIIEVTAKDAGTYECEARLPGETSPLTHSVQLKVLSGAKISRGAATDVTVNYGESKELECVPTGDPAPTVRWYRNAVLIAELNGKKQISVRPTGSFQLLTSGALVLKAAAPAHAGMFQCFVENSVGQDMRTIWLRIASAAPTIVLPPRNSTFIQDETATLICRASGAPKPEIAWYKGSSTSPINSRSSLPDGSLLIVRSKPADSGLYTCVATNVMGSALAKAALRIIVRTRITSPPAPALSVIRHDSVRIPCGFERDPSVTVTVRWFLTRSVAGATPEEVTNGPGMSTSSDGTLSIDHVVYAGMYNCFVYSNAGNDSALTNVTVKSLPDKPTVKSATLNVQNKRAVDLVWTAGFDGNSPILEFIISKTEMKLGAPTSNWIVVTSVGAKLRRFTVKGLLSARTYKFCVTAKNEVGPSAHCGESQPVKMPQLPPSGPPLSVFATSPANDTITVQFSAPAVDQQNGEILGYILRYRAYKYASFHVKNITNPATRRFTLRYLMPFTEYEVQVAAYNAMGLGVFSKSHVTITQEGTPTAPPTQVRVMALNSTAIDASWTPLISSDVNGINQGYKISLRCVDPSTDCPDRLVTVPHDGTREGTRLKARVGLLRKFALYRVSLWCFTAVGNGKASTPVEVRTQEDKPGPVSNLRFEEVVDTSITVNWAAPRFRNGIITGYTLSYYVRDVTNPKIDSFNLGPTSMTKRITDLKHQTWYIVTVVAKTAKGDGTPSSSSVRSGVPPMKPTAPSNLVWSNALARSVVVQFTPGFDGNTSISKWIFEAQIRNSDASNLWTEIFSVNSPEANRLTVSNLRPHTRYRLRLIAENIKGRSPASIPTEWFWTQEAAPDAAPQGLLMRVTSAHRIQARWRPLPELAWNGKSGGYRIFYRLSKRAGTFATKDVRGSNENSLMIATLQPFTAYEMKIGAFNDRGIGPTSAVVKDTTWEAPPSIGPEDVFLRTLNATAISLSWSPMANSSSVNGILLGYRIFYQLSGSSKAQVKVVSDPKANSTDIGGLIGFSIYSVQIAAFNRMGTGPKTPSYPARTTTERAPPLVPARPHFPFVNESMAVLAWSPPSHPQGEVSGYRVSYWLASGPTAGVPQSLPAAQRSFTATGLRAQTSYYFQLAAANERGPGSPVRLSVTTSQQREVPMQTSKPSVLTSKSGSDHVAITWSPKWQSSAPIRNFTAQFRRNDASAASWVTVPQPVLSNQVMIRGLSPATMYLFRVAANNDVGQGPFSATVGHQTVGAVPSAVPEVLNIEPIDRTTLEVKWKIIPTNSWNGQPTGYRIVYKRWRSGDNLRLTNVGHWRTSARLSSLSSGWYYELRLAAFNAEGQGPLSAPKFSYVGEAKPAAAPPNFSCSSKGSTIVSCSWDKLSDSQSNGDLLGFKIYVLSLGLIKSNRRRRATNRERMVAITSATSNATISDLKPFHRYNVRIAAFNPAGDGPPSTSFEVRTKQSTPGPPGPVTVSEVTLQSALLTWAPPAEPNGLVTYYRVQYHQANAVDGLVRKVEDVVKARSGQRPQFRARSLEKNVVYIFLVSARTTVGWGPSRNASVTTGPQPGSPSAPIQLTVVQDGVSAALNWRVTTSGNSPLIGAIIEARRQNTENWVLVEYLRPGIAVLTYRVDFQKLQPNSHYHFRVTVLNSNGISGPSAPSAWVKTPDYGQGPFYKQWWFLVIVALCGVILIILTASILCLTGRNRRARARARARTHQKYGYGAGEAKRHSQVPIIYATYGLPAVSARSSVYNNSLAFDASRGYIEPEDGGFAAAARDREMRAVPVYGTVGRHNHGVRSPGSTLARTSQSTGALGPEIHSTLSRKHLKSPPRPSPASVLTARSSDDDSKQPIPSSKASSSSGASTQKRRPESDSEFTDEFDEEDNFTKVPPPMSFFEGRQPPASTGPGNAWEMSGYPSGTFNPYSLSDTESTLPYNPPNRMSLNKAGSRAPIPSYSSFV